MSEIPTFPKLKYLLFSHKQESIHSPSKNELPKSVTQKLDFLKIHKEEIQQKAINEFISKKCTALTDYNVTPAKPLLNGDLSKVVSTRTASLVNLKNTPSESRINNLTLTKCDTNICANLETSSFFNTEKNINQISNVTRMDNSGLDLNAVFDDEVHLFTQNGKTNLASKVPLKSSKLCLAKLKGPKSSSALSIPSASVKEVEEEKCKETKKQFTFGRVPLVNIITNTFPNNKVISKLVIATSARTCCQENKKPTASSSMLKEQQANTDTSLQIKKQNRKAVNENKSEISEQQAVDEFNEYMLSNMDWDDGDWTSTKKNQDSNKTILNKPAGTIKQSLITAGDYVDDDFDFSQLGVENIQPQCSNQASNHIDLTNEQFEDEFDDGLSESMSNLPNMHNEGNINESRFIPIDVDVTTRKDDTAAFQKEYPHSSALREVLHEKFGLKQFRPNQQEIINATLELHDCFVLMPTGGGKSLCYQLPAIVTPGVTIVISPLRALIVDQVNKLTSLDIPAAHMCADVSNEARTSVVRSLRQLEPAVKLLYLTPEKLIASRATFDLLLDLYGREKLARIVLDEAHCLSQWGHDFRPDYKQLRTLKTNFPQTPIMCLTATATNVVQQDVINVLNLKNVKTFIRSFNRGNIKYEVVDKTKAMATNEIVKLIQSKFRRMSGIVYCLVRKDCDTLALDLRKNGIKAKSYHAGLGDKQREQVQSQWMNNEYNVICATIAFGMGIDKPDVRFVIHNSMPKSLEAFYQESGRAGRDGETAHSYLFYSFGDVVRLQKIIRMDKAISKNNLEGHFDQVAQMAQYCENRVDCRRYLQLLHLGEKFNRQLCMKDKRTICDNCSKNGTIVVQDVMKESRELAALVHDIGSQRNFTMLHYVDVYRGSKVKKIIDLRHNNHKYYGAGAHLNKTDVHRIMKELSFRKVLKDICEYSGEFPVIYVKPGPNYPHLFQPNMQLTIPITSKVKKTPAPVVEATPDFVDSPGSPEPGPSRLQRPQPVSMISPPKDPDRRVAALKVKCHEELLEKCAEFAAQQQSNLSSIMNLSAIKVMSVELPTSEADFLKLQYVTKANFEKYGKDFLLITQKYRREVDQIEAEKAIAGINYTDFNDDWGSSPTTSSRSGSYRGRKRKFTAFRRGSWKRGKKKS